MKVVKLGGGSTCSKVWDNTDRSRNGSAPVF